jgi:Ca-activated chloride channel family protein
VLIDWTRNGKAVAEQLSRYYFTARNAKGISLNTALYDSFYLGIEKMGSGAHPKQAILLITDGQDTDSRYTFSEVRARLKETGVLLYSIGIYGGNDPASSLGLEGSATLAELSAISGGKAYFPQNAAEMNEFFDRIAAELRHQYVLGFKPSKDKADGKWHQIKIKVTPPLTEKGKKQSVYVRSRESYYAMKKLR